MEHYGDNARWFIGVAINNLDPLQLGRVQVRIFGIHSRNNTEIPNYALPWATVLQPTTSGGTSGIGMMPQILPGAQVFGMFLDGKGSQIPCVVGVMPKIEIPFNSGSILNIINNEADTIRATIIEAAINCFVILCKV